MNGAVWGDLFPYTNWGAKERHESSKSQDSVTSVLKKEGGIRDTPSKFGMEDDVPFLIG